MSAKNGIPKYEYDTLLPTSHPVSIFFSKYRNGRDIYKGNDLGTAGRAEALKIITKSDHYSAHL